MFKCHSKLGLKQREVAELLEKEDKTYHRLETRGDGLSNFFDILNIFRVLHFSIKDVIDVLELPPLTVSEIKSWQIIK